jgi:hypothetical protein
VNADAGPEAAIDVLGGAPGTGGRSGSGGAGSGFGGYFGGGYGGHSLDWSAGTGGASSPCGSVPQIPGDAKSLCTFTGDVGYGCLASKVGVFVDSARTYFSLDHGLGIVQCPVGTTNSSVFVDDNARAPGEMDDSATLRGQTLANGTIRFVCSGYRRFGDDWDYRFTCGTSGVETIQPGLKGGDLYVLIPAATLDGGLAGYQGHIYSYYQTAQSVFFQPLGGGKEGSLGTYPVKYSVDGKTFWFNDPSGAQITIRLDANFEVIDIQRQSCESVSRTMARFRSAPPDPAMIADGISLHEGFRADEFEIRRVTRRKGKVGMAKRGMADVFSLCAFEGLCPHLMSPAATYTP